MLEGEQFPLSITDAVIKLSGALRELILHFVSKKKKYRQSDRATKNNVIATSCYATLRRKKYCGKRCNVYSFEVTEKYFEQSDRKLNALKLSKRFFKILRLTL